MSRQKHFIRQRDGCLTACVARIFHKNDHDVPLFIKSDRWFTNLKRYFRRRGYVMRAINYIDRATMPRGTVIAIGRSWNGPRRYHAVLYKGRKKFFDSSSSQRYLKGKPQFLLVWDAAAPTAKKTKASKARSRKSK